MNNFLFVGTVPINNFLLVGTVPMNNFLFVETVPTNNFFLLKKRNKDLTTLIFHLHLPYTKSLMNSIQAVPENQLSLFWTSNIVQNKENGYCPYSGHQCSVSWIRTVSTVHVLVIKYWCPEHGQYPLSMFWTSNINVRNKDSFHCQPNGHRWLMSGTWTVETGLILDIRHWCPDYGKVFCPCSRHHCPYSQHQYPCPCLADGAW